MNRSPNLCPSHTQNRPSSQSPNPNSGPHHRPLLPAPPHSEPSRGTSSPSVYSIGVTPKRPPASSACGLCRAKKTKCDNQRPSCGRCLHVNTPCVYDADVNETSYQALKRKYSAVSSELKDLRELFECLRQRPPDEANEILARIRDSGDPAQVLQLVRDAALIISSPSPQSRLRDASSESFDHTLDTHLIAIQVPAQPWTGVADDAVISNLVSQFLGRDNIYLLPGVVDRDAFVRDMCAADPARAQHCSALLVNSICAMSSLRLPHCRDLVPLFLGESNRHLTLEQGRASLPSSIALYLLYLVSACSGRDRAGLHFRTWSLEMLARLDLERKYSEARVGVAGEEKERHRISRVLWGLFVLDTRFSMLYGQLPSTPPSVPHHCLDLPEYTTDDAAFATSTKHPLPEGEGYPSLSSGILEAAYDLAKLRYEIQRETVHPTFPIDSEENAKTQLGFLQQLYASQPSMPTACWRDGNSSCQLHYMRLFWIELSLSVLGTLPSHLAVPDPPDANNDNDTNTAQQHCLAHTKLTLEIVDDLFEQETHLPEHFLIGTALYHCLVNLIPSLGPLPFGTQAGIPQTEVETEDIFNAACARLHSCAQNLPLLGRLLQIVGALAWKLGKQVPPGQARSAIESAAGVGEDTSDIPVSFKVPKVRGIVQHLDSDVIGADLGFLIAEWLQSTSKTRHPSWSETVGCATSTCSGSSYGS